jgi:hypothetical protein
MRQLIGVVAVSPLDQGHDDGLAAAARDSLATENSTQRQQQRVPAVAAALPHAVTSVPDDANSPANFEFNFATSPSGENSLVNYEFGNRDARYRGGGSVDIADDGGRERRGLASDSLASHLAFLLAESSLRHRPVRFPSILGEIDDAAANNNNNRREGRGGDAGDVSGSGGSDFVHFEVLHFAPNSSPPQTWNAAIAGAELTTLGDGGATGITDPAAAAATERAAVADVLETSFAILRRRFVVGEDAAEKLRLLAAAQQLYARQLFADARAVADQLLMHIEPVWPDALASQGLGNAAVETLRDLCAELATLTPLQASHWDTDVHLVSLE